jgi:hypothetical protein
MDSWKEMDRITFEIACLEITYSGLSEENRACYHAVCILGHRL